MIINSKSVSEDTPQPTINVTEGTSTFSMFMSGLSWAKMAKAESLSQRHLVREASSGTVRQPRQDQAPGREAEAEALSVSSHRMQVWLVVPLYRWENSISKGVRRDRGNGFTVTEMTLEFRTVLFL